VLSVHHAARLRALRDEAAEAGGVDVLPEGWIHEAWTPNLSESDKYTKGFGYYWQIRQDGGY
jgi:hypothetical protein